jgi:hypothetical protein
LIFAEAGRSDRPRRALHRVLGGRRYEHLLGLLAFIRTAHYWTVLHPNLTRRYRAPLRWELVGVRLGSGIGSIPLHLGLCHRLHRSHRYHAGD